MTNRGSNLLPFPTGAFHWRPAFGWQLLIALALMTGLSCAHAQVFGPTPYTRSADTPAGFAAGPVNIEDFEGTETHPDLSISGRFQGPGGLTDSVDYDDGALNGSGSPGRSRLASNVARVTFATFPVSAGMVWTDGPDAVTFEAFDRQGVSLGVSGPHNLNDGSFAGTTAEDRFFGARSVNGIGAIELRSANTGTNNIEFDHIQWTVGSGLAGNTASFPTPSNVFLKAGTVSDLHLISGQYLVAGNFVRVGNSQRPAIARITPSGIVSGSFSQSTINPSTFLVVQPDSTGKLYVTDGARMLRLNSDGTRDTSFAQVFFNPTFARALALVSDGIIVGGAFSEVNQQARQGLAKIRLDGTLDGTFNIVANDVRRIIATGSDEVIIAGAFQTAGGLGRVGIAKLSTAGAGSVAPSWNPQLAGASAAVQDLVSDGTSVWIGGSFTSVAGQQRGNLAKVSLATGTLDTSWIVNSSSTVQRLSLVGGNLFAATNSISLYSNPPAAALQRQLAKISASTAVVDPSFDPRFGGISSQVNLTRVVQADSTGRLVIAGHFTTANNLPRFGVAQLNVDGSTDTVVVPNGAFDSATISRVAFDEANDRVYALGDFATVDGSAIGPLVRIVNGVLDTTWRPQVPLSISSQLQVIPGQGVWVSTAAGVHRLNETDGSEIATWVNASTGVTAMTSSPQAIYISNAQGVQRLPITANGVVDPACAGAGSSFAEMAFDPTSNSLIGRPSVSLDLRRLDASNCAAIASFGTPTLNSTIFSFALDARGGVWIAGNFTTAGAATVRSPLRLLLSSGAIDTNVLATQGSDFNFVRGADQSFVYGTRVTSGGDTALVRLSLTGGTIDSSWKVAAQQGFVQSIAVGQTRVIAAGAFSGIAGESRFGLAAIPKQDRLLRSGFE